jgi:hypothetical protein
MAAGAWTFYNRAKFYIGNGTIDLDTDAFRMALYTSASNADTVTFSGKGEISAASEVTEANGYSSSGKSITAVTWATGASAGEYRFDSTAVVWTATGGTIPNVKFAVIYESAAATANNFLLCYSQLSTSQFTVSTGNTLTITPSANGIFELN